MSYQKFDLESAVNRLHILWISHSEDIALYNQLSSEFTQPRQFTPSATFQEIFSYGQKRYWKRLKHLEEMRKNRLMWPFLYEIEHLHPKLHIWESIPLDVDPSQDLTGEPDYCVARDDLFPRAPYCIIMEAKKEDLEQGWGQTLAAMRGAQILNQRESSSNIPIYGAVSTGEEWQFGKLQENQFLIHPKIPINVLESEEKTLLVLRLLDIIFTECEKNIG
jgi:hypothetical protein